MKKKILKKILNISIILLATGLVLYFSLKDDYQSIVNEIKNMNKFWLFVAFTLVFGFWFFKAIVEKKLVKKFNKKYRMRDAFKLILELNFFHAVTPFATGGQPYEIYSLKKANIKLTDATNITIQNFIVYQIALVTLGLIAIFANYVLKIFPDVGLLKELVTLGFVINFLVIVLLFVITYAKKLDKLIMRGIIFVLTKVRIVKDKEATLNKFHKYLNEFHEGANILLSNKFEFIQMILCQFISLLCMYLVPLVLLYGTGDYTSFDGFKCVVTSAYIMLIGSFVPIPGGTGGLEYGFIAFYGNFIKGSKLNAIMLVWRLVTYYFGILVGALVLGFKRKKD